MTMPTNNSNGNYSHMESESEFPYIFYSSDQMEPIPLKAEHCMRAVREPIRKVQLHRFTIMFFAIENILDFEPGHVFRWKISVIAEIEETVTNVRSGEVPSHVHGGSGGDSHLWWCSRLISANKLSRCECPWFAILHRIILSPLLHAIENVTSFWY